MLVGSPGVIYLMVGSDTEIQILQPRSELPKRQIDSSFSLVEDQVVDPPLDTGVDCGAYYVSGSPPQPVPDLSENPASDVLKRWFRLLEGVKYSLPRMISGHDGQTCLAEQSASQA